MFGRSGAKNGAGELRGRGAGENTLSSTVRIATLDPVRKGRLCPGPRLVAGERGESHKYG